MKDVLHRLDRLIVGGATTVVTLFLGYLWWMFTPQNSVPMWLYSLSIIIAYILLLLVYVVASKNTETVYVLPKVKAIRRTESNMIFLLEKNELFMQGAYVTIFYQDEGDQIEVVLGVGYIETVNSQGNMQIVFSKVEERKEVRALISQLSDNRHSKDAIRIKPTVHRMFFEEESNTCQLF